MSEDTDDGSFRPIDHLNKLYTVDDARTTAKRLAAYRDELREVGFTEIEVARFLETAAPSLIEDIEVKADLEGETHTIGAVTVRLSPHIDEDDLRRIVERIHTATRSAAEGDR